MDNSRDRFQDLPWDTQVEILNRMSLQQLANFYQTHKIPDSVSSALLQRRFPLWANQEVISRGEPTLLNLKGLLARIAFILRRFEPGTSIFQIRDTELIMDFSLDYEHGLHYSSDVQDKPPAENPLLIPIDLAVRSLLSQYTDYRWIYLSNELPKKNFVPFMIDFLERVAPLINRLPRDRYHVYLVAFRNDN